MTVDELAAATCVDPADVRVVLEWLDDGEGAPRTDIPAPVATADSFGVATPELTVDPSAVQKTARVAGWLTAALFAPVT